MPPFDTLAELKEFLTNNATGMAHDTLKVAADSREKRRADAAEVSQAIGKRWSEGLAAFDAVIFAMRRRFFWIAAPFDTEALEEIWANQWQREKPRITLEQAKPQLGVLATNIERLNKAIAESAELGPAYQLGHAFFGDLAYFVAQTWPGRRPAGNRILWDRHGKPQAPLTALWAHSIEPLLAQYLAASDLQQDQLTEMKSHLFTSPT